MASVKDKDLGMEKIMKLLGKFKKTRINVGVFSSSINSEGKKPVYVADYATANEYGTDKVPERSFVRSTFDEKEASWSKEMENVLDAITSGKLKNIDSEIYKIGAMARTDIINKIDSNINPPNAPATIKKKGIHKNKTLIDDGILRQSIEARIEDSNV